jgi:hypothetical protein
MVIYAKKGPNRQEKRRFFPDLGTRRLKFFSESFKIKAAAFCVGEFCARRRCGGRAFVSALNSMLSRLG